MQLPFFNHFTSPRKTKRQENLKYWEDTHALLVAQRLFKNTESNKEQWLNKGFDETVVVTATYHQVPHGLARKVNFTEPVVASLKERLLGAALPLKLQKVCISDRQPRKYSLQFDTISFTAVYLRK